MTQDSDTSKVTSEVLPAEQANPAEPAPTSAPAPAEDGEGLVEQSKKGGQLAFHLVKCEQALS